MSRLKTILWAQGVLVGWCASVSAQAPAPATAEWVRPFHPATAREAKSVRFTERYQYTQSLYGDQEITAENGASLLASSTGPERAFVARMNSTLRPDYQAWLATWDPPSWDFARDRYAQEGKDEQYWLTLWRNTFNNVRVRPVRKIETGPYVIVTYRVFDAQGQAVSGAFELPVVFKESSDGEWRVTLDLRADPLLQSSPWTRNRVEGSVTIR
jgi:hypothetical protein